MLLQLPARTRRRRPDPTDRGSPKPCSMPRALRARTCRRPRPLGLGTPAFRLGPREPEQQVTARLLAHREKVFRRHPPRRAVLELAPRSEEGQTRTTKRLCYRSGSPQRADVSGPSSPVLCQPETSRRPCQMSGVTLIASLPPSSCGERRRMSFREASATHSPPHRYMSGAGQSRVTTPCGFFLDCLPRLGSRVRIPSPVTCLRTFIRRRLESPGCIRLAAW